MDDTRPQPGVLVSGRFAELEESLLERVRELRQGRPLAPLTIVVGSAALCTRLNDLLVHELGAVANVRVVTLVRFAVDAVTAADGAPPQLARPVVRERLVRGVVEGQRTANRLRYFAVVSQRPHFAQALTASFDDLREGCVRPNSRWTVWARGRAAAKGDDLAALYAAYCDALERRGLLDDAALYERAAAALRAGAARQAESPARTLLYGIYDLNQAQEQLVAALIAAGADVFVPAPLGGGTAGAPAVRLAQQAGRSQALLRPGTPGERDLDRVARALVARSGDAGAERLTLTGDGSVALVSVPDDQHELREAVREVLTAASGGARFYDCAVVVPRGADVDRVAARFAAAGLPVACRRPARAAGVRALLLLLDCIAPVAGRDYARRPVLDLLAVTAVPAVDASAWAAETALWADEARLAGVVAGGEQWRDRPARRRWDLQRRCERARLSGAGDDDDSDERLVRLTARLQAVTSLEAAAIRLLDACRNLPVRAGWGAWAEALATVTEAAFAAETAAAAADAARRLAALDVLGETVAVREMAAVLRELLGRDAARKGRVGREGVAVLTPLELRGLRFHTVVLTGLAEGGLPTRGRPDPILGDGERRETAGALGVRLPLAEEREAESDLLFALAVEAARERLTLLAPRADAAGGRPRQPSRFVLRLASSAAGRAVAAETLWSREQLQAPSAWRRVAGRVVQAAANEPIWVDARERDLSSLLRPGFMGPAARVTYLAAVLAGDGPAAGRRQAERRLAQWRASRHENCGPHDGLLGEAARVAFAAATPFAAEVSPTQLERYLTCPFTYLLRSVIGLEAPEEPHEGLEMEPREFGRLAHDILEGTYAQAIAQGLDLEGALAALEPVWARECERAETRGVTGAALAWRACRAALLDDLRETLQRDPVFTRGDGRPWQAERPFGEAEGAAVAITLADGRRLRFRGRVDRIDATPRGVRVIDYKTGRGTTEEKRLKDGLSVQLPVYALAAAHLADEEGLPAGELACVYRFVTRRGGFRELPAAYSGAEAEVALAALAGSVVTLAERGLFPRTTAGTCEFCDVRYACGFSAWARKRKRGSAALADVVALQGGAGPAENGGHDA